MHPIKSIVARSQGFIIKNIAKSKYGKRLRSVKDIHKGERCFIVANGPSLTLDDLNTLYKNKEYTFGMNRIFKFFDKTEWRPTFYVCEDINIFNDSIDAINSISSDMKFIPINHHFYDNINVEGAYYFLPNYDRKMDFPNSFSTDISRQIDSLGTVTFTCINIAAYMGFSEIYLLGVDNNYRVTIDEDGNTVVDKDAKDYFCDDYDKDIKDIVVHDMGANIRAYRKAKCACDEMGIQIYNATRGGKLEVFPRVGFDSLFEEVSQN